MENTGTTQGDLSISDLRSILAGEEPTAAPAQETPKPEAEATETTSAETEATASESETEQGSDPENKGDRGPDGKFKAKDEDAETSPGVQKRIDKAVRAQREAERRAIEAERRLAEIQGSRPAQENAQQAAGELKMEDFPDVDSYFKAVAERKEAEVRRAQAETAAQAERQREQEALQASHLARVEAAREKYDDYEATISGAQSLDISNELAQQILHSDHGPDVAYYLAKHPAELKRIMALPLVRHAAEFGRLETRFTSPQPKPQPKPLPKPAATVGGAPSSREPELHDRNIDMGTFKRLARARMAG